MEDLPEFVPEPTAETRESTEVSVAVSTVSIHGLSKVAGVVHANSIPNRLLPGRRAFAIFQR
ncbi:MAG: hypothetical protein KDA89_21875, partial [Planctomycetaceae bacterium]|nr:hypothetical protein [Planctomycetaceae bacterium]